MVQDVDVQAPMKNKEVGLGGDILEVSFVRKVAALDVGTPEVMVQEMA
jgi:hypothetical protein